MLAIIKINTSHQNDLLVNHPIFRAYLTQEMTNEGNMIDIHKRFFFLFTHLFKMHRAQVALNKLQKLPKLESCLVLIRHYLNGYAGRLTCRTCFPKRIDQLLERAYLCNECDQFSTELCQRRHEFSLEYMTKAFKLIRQGQIPYLEPKDTAKEVAVILVNTDCDDLAVIGSAAMVSFVASWKLLVNKGYMIMPYLVSGSIDPNDYIERALAERGRDNGHTQVTHLEIISHGGSGSLCLSIGEYRLHQIKDDGSVLLNSCFAANNSAASFKSSNPKLSIFASETMTIAAEPIVKNTITGPRVTEVIYASNFIKALFLASKMIKL